MRARKKNIASDLTKLLEKLANMSYRTERFAIRMNVTICVTYNRRTEMQKS